MAIVLAIVLFVIRIDHKVGNNQEEPWATTGYGPICRQWFSKHLALFVCLLTAKGNSVHESNVENENKE